MTARFAILSSLLLAACSPTAEAPPAPTASPTASLPGRPAQGPDLAPVVSLAGEWRVAGIDGAPLDEPYGLALSGNEEELWWEPRCFGAVRSYAIDGLALTIGARRDPPATGPDGAPAPVCAIAPPPRIFDVMRALDAAETVGRDASNGVILSGGGHSLTLYSQ